MIPPNAVVRRKCRSTPRLCLLALLGTSLASCSLIVDVGDLSRSDADVPDGRDGDGVAEADADGEPPDDAGPDVDVDADADGDDDAEVSDDGAGDVPDECDGQPDFTPCTVVTTPDRSYDICVRGDCVSPGCGNVTCNPPGPNWTLPDSNQRTCYDNSAALTSCPGTPGSVDCGDTPFCGQDWQYGWDTTHASTERFTRTDTAEPVVTDNVTGLIWHGCAAGLAGSLCDTGSALGFNWADALRYCDSLTWAGLSDWRLPDRYELAATVVDYGVSGSHVDSTIFPAEPGSAFWSSSFSGTSGAWNVQGGSASAGDTSYEGYHARCVRRPPVPGPAERLMRAMPVANQPVVADAVTGLVWQGCAAGLTGAACSSGDASRSWWEGALAYCENLSWGGSDDWYLPNSTELANIVDDTRESPSINIAAFPATPGDVFWSSTSNAGGPSSAWFVNFFHGVTSPAGGKLNPGFGNPKFIRCVRSGP